MNKTPAEWRREWLALLWSYEYWMDLPQSPYVMDSARTVRLQMSNAILGYARSRGWWHV